MKKGKNHTPKKQNKKNKKNKTKKLTQQWIREDGRNTLNYTRLKD